LNSPASSIVSVIEKAIVEIRWAGR